MLWVLPMMHECCRSQFLDNTAATVFVKDEVQAIYDAVDMLLESFIYVPTVFLFNCITTCLLHYRYRKCMKSQAVRPSVLNDLGRNGLLQMPSVGWIADQGSESGGQAYLQISVRANARRGKNQNMIPPTRQRFIPQIWQTLELRDELSYWKIHTILSPVLLTLSALMSCWIASPNKCWSTVWK